MKNNENDQYNADFIMVIESRPDGEKIMNI